MSIKAILLLSVLAVLFSFSKNPETIIDVNNLDQNKLESLILEK